MMESWVQRSAVQNSNRANSRDGHPGHGRLQRSEYSRGMIEVVQGFWSQGCSEIVHSHTEALRSCVT